MEYPRPSVQSNLVSIIYLYILKYILRNDQITFSWGTMARQSSYENTDKPIFSNFEEPLFNRSNQPKQLRINCY